MILTITSFVVLICAVEANNFPSLLSTNATLAIIIDKEYLGDDFGKIRTTIEDYIIFAKREILKHGGVNVLFYTWTTIKVKKDVSAILSIASCRDTWRLFEIARAENVLHIAISESDCPRLPQDMAFTIPLVKRGEELAQIILDLRTENAYNWKSVTILFDHTLARDMVTRVLTAVTADNRNIGTPAATISLAKISEDYSTIYDVQYIRQILTKIAVTNTGTNFLVVTSMELVPLMMDVSKSLNLVNTENQWMYIISNTDFKNETSLDVVRHLREGDNVAFVYNITNPNVLCKQGLECYITEVLDAFSRALDSAILEEVDLASQVSDEEWEAIRPTKSDRRTFLLNNMKSFLAQNGICENCTAWQMKAGETWGREFNRNSNESEIELIQVGIWKPREGPMMADVLFPHVVHGFRGKNVALAAVHNPPWQFLETNSTGSTSFRGIVADVVNELSKSLNFTYTIIPVGNSSMGSDYEASSMVTYNIPDVVINMVRNKQVLLAASAFTVTEGTKAVVNFTMPISTQPYGILAARPKELSRALLFMSPFTRGTWFTLFGAILSMGPVLYVVNRFTPVYEYKGISMKGGLSSVYNCMWYIYGAVLQQGGMYLPQADSARIIVGCWWLVVLVLSTTYCGNLVAFLTFPNNDKPISTLDDVIEHKASLTWSLASGSFFEGEAKNSEEARYQLIYRDSIKDLPDSDSMMESIKNGKHVHIDWKIKLQYMMKKQFLTKGSCDFALGREEFSEERVGMILAKDNPYTDRINREIKRLHQMGLIQKWLRDYLPKRDRCYKSRSSSNANNHTVNLDDMQGSFFVLLLGFIVSIAIILVEYALHRYHTMKNKKKTVQPFVT